MAYAWQVWFAMFCILMGSFLFFRNISDFFFNTFFRQFWYQAEKCYANFELMFLDESFTMAKCRSIVLVSMLVLGFFAYLLARSAPGAIPGIAATIGMIAGWLLPGIVTTMLHRRYVDQFDLQLLDGLRMMSSGLRSGLSLQQAIGLVAKEMASPVAQEFKLVLTEYNYGKTLEEAFERMAKKIPSVDLGITIEAILVLRSTGANLVETFEIIIDTVRERKKIEGKIKGMTAMGALQGYILGVMPFVLIWIISIVNPDYIQPMFSSKIGWVLLGVVIGLVILGMVVLQKIVKIDV